MLERAIIFFLRALWASELLPYTLHKHLRPFEDRQMMAALVGKVKPMRLSYILKPETAPFFSQWQEG